MNKCFVKFRKSQAIGFSGLKGFGQKQYMFSEEELWEILWEVTALPPLVICAPPSWQDSTETCWGVGEMGCGQGAPT